MQTYDEGRVLCATFHFPNYRVLLQRDVDTKLIEMREHESQYRP